MCLCCNLILDSSKEKKEERGRGVGMRAFLSRPSVAPQTRYSWRPNVARVFLGVRSRESQHSASILFGESLAGWTCDISFSRNKW